MGKVNSCRIRALHSYLMWSSTPPATFKLHDLIIHGQVHFATSKLCTHILRDRVYLPPHSSSALASYTVEYTPATFDLSARILCSVVYMPRSSTSPTSSKLNAHNLRSRVCLLPHLSFVLASYAVKYPSCEIRAPSLHLMR